MMTEAETKTCKLCGMNIPVVAKKCPYCLHWQRWLCLQNPAIYALVFFIPMFIALGMMMTLIERPFRQWEPFQKYSQEVRIVEDKMEFGEDQYGLAVVVVGTVKNVSQVNWKDVRFQVAFYNTKGELFDTGQQEAYTYRLPAGQECPFKVSFRRQFPETEYDNYKVSIILLENPRLCRGTGSI